MAYQIPLTIKDTLEGIARHRYVLPAIQRELVWADDPERMCRLFDSILRGYPIGTFLSWRVEPEHSKQFHFYEFMLHWHGRKHRHNDRIHLADERELIAILDGQQRLTTLNIGLYGSLAHRAPRKRVDAVDGYPAKRLYVDLRYEPTEDDDMQFGFESLTDEQAQPKGDEHHRYLVGDIVTIDEPGEPIFEYVTANDLTNTPAFRVLSRLWKAVHEDGVVSYFEEREQSLSKVLDIFVRVNSGGVVLTKSDLLLSIATAQFEGRDAREEIHGLVDDLNATRHGFRFTKNLVLKAGLVLTDISDVGFKVENFTAANMRRLDEAWDDIDRSLRIGVKLLASFGFSDATLPAASVLIPIADYIHQRGLDESYVTSANPSLREDRERVRHWTLRTILKPGIWGSALDGLLRTLHQIIRDTSGGFPLEELQREMAKRGKDLNFDEDLPDALVDTPYKHKRTFALLSLLYPWVDTRNDFHIDHVFPRGLATAAKLRDQGVDPADIDEIRDKMERLGNLQLLSGPENIHKREQPPADWARAHMPDESSRNAWLSGHDLHVLPPDITDFIPFYDHRRSILRDRLVRLLGSGAVILSPDGPKAGEPDGGAPAEGTAHATPAGAVRGLVDGGKISAGQQLIATYKGERYFVTVRSDGRLEHEGEVFDSLSQAARLLTGQRAVNGWTFWSTEAGTAIARLRDAT